MVTVELRQAGRYKDLTYLMKFSDLMMVYKCLHESSGMEPTPINDTKWYHTIDELDIYSAKQKTMYGWRRSGLFTI